MTVNVVPLLKKPTLAPSMPNNYRPVTVSSTLSEILANTISTICSLVLSQDEVQFLARVALVIRAITGGATESETRASQSGLGCWRRQACVVLVR